MESVAEIHVNENNGVLVQYVLGQKFHHGLRSCHVLFPRKVWPIALKVRFVKADFVVMAFELHKFRAPESYRVEM